MPPDEPTGPSTRVRRRRRLAAVLVALVAPAPLLLAAPATTPTAAADPPAGYYDSAEGLSGTALEAELHDIVSTGATRLSYDEVWDGLQQTDADPDDPSSVVLFYQGTSHAASDHGGGVDQWNREHLWAQSHGDFGTSPGPGTDLHHLRPTDVTVNSDRGNLDFDEGGTENDEAPGNCSDSDSWEPRDADKGDVARAILYMSVRWDGGDGFPDLEVDDATGGSGPRHGKLSTLMAWNEADPPSAFEEHRNDVVYELQGNRNPFIDHPEWVADIWG